MTGISIIHAETTTPDGLLSIDIALQAHSLEYIISAIIKDISNITLGSDEDSDIIFFPGEINIELYFNMHIKDIIELFKYVKDRIENNWCSVYIKLNDDLIWQGYIDKDPETLSLDGKVIKMTFLDQTTRLKEIDPRTNPFGYADLDATRKIPDIIQDFFINPIFEDDNYINQVQIYSTMEGRILVGAEYLTFPFSEFRAALSFYFSADNNYEDLLSLLKSICLNYNLILYIGFNRTIYLLPRFAENNIIREIKKTEIYESPEYEMIDRIAGIKIKVWKGSYPKNNESNYYIETYGNYTEDDDHCEEIIIDQPAGTWPGGGFSGIAISYQSQIYWVEFNQITYKKIDGSNAGYNSLYYWAGIQNWDYIKYPRLKCKLTVRGTYNQWSPNQYYKLYDSDILFRATKFEYDLLKNQTTIYMREVGVIPNSRRLLEDGAYRLCENDSIRLLEELGGGQIVGETIYRTLEDGYNRLTEDGNKRII
jgi:hypothetical protein